MKLLDYMVRLDFQFCEKPSHCLPQNNLVAPLYIPSNSIGGFISL